MFLIKKKIPLDLYEKRERLFFHDIINLTHGLILFFNQRQNSKKGIEPSEIQMLEGEVRALQSLIKDHFHYKHKNLTNDDDWISFEVSEIAMKSLIQNYLPKGSVQILKSGTPASGAMIYFPVFYRTMNNLIKNMAEADASDIHIHFNFEVNGFSIETKNQIPDKRTRIIKGIGLESVRLLVEEYGGQFEFESTKDWWINRLFLPYPEYQTKTKKAA
jgi:hypothetical protein